MFPPSPNSPMFKLTKLITLHADADGAAVAHALRTAGQRHAARALLAPTLPGVYNGGDFIWHLQFADESAYRAAIDSAAWRRDVAVLAGAHVESAAYGGGRHGE